MKDSVVDTYPSYIIIDANELENEIELIKSDFKWFNQMSLSSDPDMHDWFLGRMNGAATLFVFTYNLLHHTKISYYDAFHFLSEYANQI